MAPATNLSDRRFHLLQGGHSTPQNVVSDPEWLPHTFDPSGRNLLFRRVSRQVHAETPFLSGTDILDRAVSMPLTTIQSELRDLEMGPLHFIFHSAFCCSTLLVDLLGATGRIVGMKEPAIFQNLLHRLARRDDAAERARLSLVLQLLARPFPGVDAVLVKPSCFANPLIPTIMEAVPDARIVLLRSKLRPFLYSLARRGIRGRTWSRQAYLACVRHFAQHYGLREGELLELTDLQVAGLAWLMRGCFFARIAKESAPMRVVELDADAVLDDPGTTLVKVAHHFGIGVDRAHASDAVTRPICQLHRKEKRLFGPTERHQERRELEKLHGEEVELVATWVEAVASPRR